MADSLILFECPFFSDWLGWKGIYAWLMGRLFSTHSCSLPHHHLTTLPYSFKRIITLSNMMFTAGLVALVAAPFALAQRGGGSVLVGKSSPPHLQLSSDEDRRARLPPIPRIRRCCSPYRSLPRFRTRWSSRVPLERRSCFMDRY